MSKLSFGELTSTRASLNETPLRAGEYQTTKFLAALDPNGRFTFQTFDDRKSKQRGELTRLLHGSFEQHRDQLFTVNARGAGVFLAINETDLAGRSASNVTRVRAVFVDLDGAPLEPVVQGPLPPSIVVQSSVNKYHCYWFCNDVPLNEFGAWQRYLARLFSGDPAVCDLPRVMRLPGFKHQKGDAFLTTLLECHPQRRYDRNQLAKAFGEPAPTEEKRQPSEQSGASAVERDARAVELAAKAVGRVAREKERGRHAQALWLGYECRRNRLCEGAARIAAQHFHNLAPDTNSDGVLDPLSIQEITSAVLNAYRDGKEVAEQKRLSSYVLRGAEMTDLKIEPRKPIIAPFLTEASLNMEFAERGLGKTWFAIELALAVAEGRKFFEWEVIAPKRVLYVDGEMPLGDLASRIRSLSGETIPDNLMLLPSETLYLEGEPLTINSAESQRRFQEALDDLEAKGTRPDVLIFDNLSSLTSGMDENSNSDLDALLPWFVGLRHQGYAVLIVHHAGKDGKQRGASRREDLLDTSIHLKRVESDLRGVREGACFEITFSKTRGMTPRPESALVQLVTDEHGRLTWTVGSLKALTTEQKAVVEIYGRPPHSQAELAERLGVTPERVSQLATRLRSKGLLAGGRGLRLTREGTALAEKLGAAELPV